MEHLQATLDPKEQQKANIDTTGWEKKLHPTFLNPPM